MNLLRNTILIAGLITVLTACKKEETPTPTPTDHTTIDPNRKGNIEFNFDNRAGSVNLILDTVVYHNALNQAITISKFDYYISNIQLINEDGSTYTVPQDSSYFLIKERISTSQKLKLKNIPEGNYTGMKFVLGVDSLRNTVDISQRSGVLDPTGEGAGMYWSWNSGYIFLKLEGDAPAAPEDTINNTHPVTYHIGGFGGMTSATINNIKAITVHFPEEKAEVREAHGTEGPNIHLFVDALKLFTGTENVDFSINHTVMFSPYSTTIANNYANMFKVDHIHNHSH